MTYFRLFREFLRVSIMTELAYRANFIVQLFQSLLELGTALGGLAVIFSFTDNLGGWRPDEVLALLGVYFLLGGVIGLVIQPGMEQLIESVRDGTLDFILTKPEDAQMLVSARKVEIWKFINIFLGMGVLAYAVIKLNEQLTGWQIAAFAVMLFAGIAIIYSFWLILATLSFWFVRVENILEIFQSMYDAGRWPVSLYPDWLRFLLTFIIPVAFATTVPAEALTGRLTWQTLVGAGLLAVFMIFISRVFWKIGLKRYSGASA
jgi:ABC-2 type transport system permease protein